MDALAVFLAAACFAVPALGRRLADARAGRTQASNSLLASGAQLFEISPTVSQSTKQVLPCASTLCHVTDIVSPHAFAVQTAQSNVNLVEMPLIKGHRLETVRFYTTPIGLSCLLIPLALSAHHALLLLVCSFFWCGRWRRLSQFTWYGRCAGAGLGFIHTAAQHRRLQPPDIFN